MKETVIVLALSAAMLQGIVPTIVTNYCNLFNSINNAVERVVTEWNCEIDMIDLDAETINATIEQSLNIEE